MEFSALFFHSTWFLRCPMEFLALFFHSTLLLTYPMEFDVTYHQYPSTKSTKKGLEILNLRFLGLIHTYALTTTISPSLMCAFTCSRLSSSKIKSVN